MKSKREVNRKTLRFEMMIFVLILAFPREITGATFFHQYDKNGNHTLNCSRMATESDTKYVWFRGSNSPSSSMLAFEPIDSDQNKTSTLQCTGCSTSSDGKILLWPAFSAGGIFACTLWTENRIRPLFNNITHCNNFDFFIVAIRNKTEEEKAFGNIPDPSEPVRAVAEQGNFTLTCELQIKHNSTEFTLYWMKETHPSRCLFSVTNEGCHGSTLSYDINCCVDSAIKERQINHSLDFSGQWIRHNLTILDVSSSDSGMYLCVVTTWDRKRVWKIAYNVSIEVKNSTLLPSSSTNELEISLGVVGGVILVCGIIWLLYWKKKAKGNPVEERPRDQMEWEMEGDDCSPYAVSSRNDINRKETMYSVVTYPPKPLQGVSTLPDGKPASESGEKLHTVYALVSK